MKTPDMLRPGDTVAITAPSGPVVPEKLEAGKKILEGMGLNVRVMESCMTAHEYLAAPDAVRLRDLHAAFADTSIRGIFAARGGYGAARLLPHLDFELIRRNPKIFAGYSDITALHIAINQIAKLVTYHSPMPAADLPIADEKTLASFRQSFFGGFAPIPPQAYKSLTKTLKFEGWGVRAGHSAEAELVGGNLSVIAASLGTPFEINTQGRILFLEEVDEPPYRVDRMLTQLKQAGKLSDATGFVLGDFSPKISKLAISELLVGKPVVAGLPVGHCMPNLTLPLGAAVRISPRESLHQLQICDRPETATGRTQPWRPFP